MESDLGKEQTDCAFSKRTPPKMKSRITGKGETNVTMSDDKISVMF